MSRASQQFQSAPRSDAQAVERTREDVHTMRENIEQTLRAYEADATASADPCFRVAGYLGHADERRGDGGARDHQL